MSQELLVAKKKKKVASRASATARKKATRKKKAGKAAPRNPRKATTKATTRATGQRKSKARAKKKAKPVARRSAKKKTRRATATSAGKKKAKPTRKAPVRKKKRAVQSVGLDVLKPHSAFGDGEVPGIRTRSVFLASDRTALDRAIEGRRGKKRYIVAAAASLIVVVMIATAWRYYGSIPDTESTLELSGLQAPVEVRRDQFGVPFIQAENQADLMYAAGYVAAQNRLWQMNLLRLTSRGQLAEFLNPKLIEADRFTRTIGFRRIADQMWNRLTDFEKAALESYAAGVNEFMENETLPPEFAISGLEPPVWEARDSLSIYILANYDLANNLNEELAFLRMAARMGPEKAAFLFPIYPDESLPFTEARRLSGLDLSDPVTHASIDGLLRGEQLALQSLGGVRDMGASNNWALAPSRTTTGKSLLANDPHLAAMIPGFWMVQHLRAPGYDVAGVTIPGIPIVLVGYNGHIAWGVTMLMADSQDVFVERLNEIDGRLHYLYKDEWYPVRETTETIRLKGGDEEQLTIRYTHHGPLINSVIAEPRQLPFQPSHGARYRYGLSMRWSLADGDDPARAFFQLAAARNTADARSALSNLRGMYLNVVIADESNVAWQTTGRIPYRAGGHTGKFPVPGWTGEYEWEGYLAYDKQPHSIEPTRGYVATANHRVIPAAARPYVSKSWASPWRITRIERMLGARASADLRSARSMQMDSVSVLAEKAVAMLQTIHGSAGGQQALSAMGDGERARIDSAMALFESFDYDMNRESGAAALLNAFYSSLARRIFFDEETFSEDPDAFFSLKKGYSATEDHLLARNNSPFFDDARTPEIETKELIVLQSLADAHEFCEDEMGGDTEDWGWGQLHYYYFPHSLAKAPWIGSVLDSVFSRGPYPAPGDRSTINVSGYPIGKFDYRTTYLPSLRLVVDFSLVEPAYLTLTGGESGNPASDNYDDLIPHFIEGTMLPLPFGAGHVERHYDQVQLLTPLED